jgi:hypothetical protein
MDKPNELINASRRFFGALLTPARGNGRIGLQLLNSGIARAFIQLWVDLPLKLFMADNLIYLV